MVDARIDKRLLQAKRSWNIQALQRTIADQRSLKLPHRSIWTENSASLRAVLEWLDCAHIRRYPRCNRANCQLLLPFRERCQFYRCFWYHLTLQTVDLLRHHKAQQAQVKLANRGTYQDFGLVFAKDWWVLRTHGETLGHPLQSKAIGQREFKRLIAQAGIKPIKFHGPRHTCATLLLQAGVPVHMVQERLGHKRIEVTPGSYAHVLPAMEQDAAKKLAALLQA